VVSRSVGARGAAEDVLAGVRPGVSAAAEGGGAMTPLTHFSLFTGIGGLDLAAEWAGFRTIGQVEYANYPFRVLRQRFGHMPRWRDIRDVTGEAIIERCGVPTVVSGGFPCQPHSLAGKRLASCDERDLWGELARVVREVKPRWFVGENVAGLRSSESGRFFGRVLRDLAEMGYTVGWGSWEAADVGAPHHRERVFIVAHTDLPRPQGRVCGSVPKRPGKRVARSRGALSDPSRELLDWCGTTGNRRAEPANGRWWDSEPPVGRVADGVPSRVDRLRALGNAVVPQQAFPIFQAIAAIEMGAIA